MKVFSSVRTHMGTSRHQQHLSKIAIAGAVVLLSTAMTLTVTTVGVTGAAAASATSTYARTLAGPSLAPMYPSGLIWDAGNSLCASGCIVVADTGYNRISVFDPTAPPPGPGMPATPVLQFGGYGTGPGQFNTPRDVAVDPVTHWIYVADAANARVQAFKPDGTFVWQSGAAGSMCSPACSLSTPIGVSFDAVNKQVLVADTGHSVIKAFDPMGKFLWKSVSGLMKSPREARRGPDGRIWVADYNDEEIRAFTADNAGVWKQPQDITLGDGLAGGHKPGELNAPYNVAFSPDGNTVYVADTGNERIALWTKDATTNTWGSPAVYGKRCPANPCPDNMLFQLRRVTVDPSTGNIWAADFWGSGIHEFFPDGSTTGATEIDGNPAPAPGFAEAYGVTVAPDGTVYGVDRLNQRIERYAASPPCDPSTDATMCYLNDAGSRGVSVGLFSWPETAAAAPDGSVWVGDTRNGRLQHFTAALSSPVVVGGKGTGTGQFDYIEGVSAAASGTIWVADSRNNRIQSYDPSTKIFKPYGSSGSGDGQFNNPEGVAVSPTNIFVADTGNNRVEELDLAGNYVGQLRGFNQPQGLALAPDGTLWVADTMNNQIVHLSSALANLGDTISTCGGTCSPSTLNQPHSVAVHQNNGTTTLYVADTYNDRVLEFTLS